MEGSGWEGQNSALGVVQPYEEEEEEADEEVRSDSKVAKSDCHVCRSVCMELPGPQYTDFHEIWYFNVFQKSVKKIQVSLKSDKNNR